MLIINLASHWITEIRQPELFVHYHNNRGRGYPENAPLLFARFRYMLRRDSRTLDGLLPATGKVFRCKAENVVGRIFNGYACTMGPMRSNSVYS
jgi:hypothetical protein